MRQHKFVSKSTLVNTSRAACTADQTVLTLQSDTWSGLQLPDCQCVNNCLLHQRYNSGTVLAFPTISFHLCRSWTRSDHFTTFSFFRSFLTSSSHMDLGLPTGRFVNGCHLYIFFTTLDSGILFSVRTNLISEIWHSLLCSCVVLVHIMYLSTLWDPYNKQRYFPTQYSLICLSNGATLWSPWRMSYIFVDNEH